jgi:hypothetical protein
VQLVQNVASKPPAPSGHEPAQLTAHQSQASPGPPILSPILLIPPHPNGGRSVYVKMFVRCRNLRGPSPRAPGSTGGAGRVVLAGYFTVYW